MKLSSGKRIGQSGGELAAAALFSFLLHAILLAAAVIYIHAAPLKHIPLFYEVKLVGAPASPEVPPQEPAPKQPKQPAAKTKAAPKEKRAVLKEKKAALKPASRPSAKTSAVPELAKKQQKPVAPPSPPVETPPAAPAAPAGGTAGEHVGPSAKGEGIAVTATEQDFKYAWYLNQVRDKISQNWRPPPDAPGATARVIFSINRSGWVGAVNLDAEHSNGSFGFKQAAIRAIRASNPFPELPEDFSKQTLEFSVDLMAE